MTGVVVISQLADLATSCTLNTDQGRLEWLEREVLDEGVTVVFKFKMKAFVEYLSYIFNCRDEKDIMESIIRYIKWSLNYLAEAFATVKVENPIYVWDLG